MESEIGFPNQAPAFLSCVDKMMTVLLDLAGLSEENGIRPHSLKVTTISAIMGEIVKRKANLSRLEAQGNYRAVTAQDMGKVYSRNFAQRQIFVSKFAQKSFSENTNADGFPSDIPEFPGKVQGYGDTINLEVHGEKPLGWALSILQNENN